jgi:hypothetical protein
MGADESPPFFVFLEMKSEMVEEKTKWDTPAHAAVAKPGVLIYDVAF